MPLEGDHENDLAFESADGPVCIHDSENGKIKPGKEIFEGGVKFFIDTVTDGDRELAERLTRKNMNALDYWQSHPLVELGGEEATDQEFDEAMEKL